MSDISIQFHALPEEILPLLQDFIAKIGPGIVAIRFRPFEAVTCDPAKMDDAFGDESVRRIAFTLTAPVVAAEGMNAFLDKNPDVLLLDIGRRSERGLGESWLSAKGVQPEVARKWGLLVRRLRAITEEGAIAVNPKSGATAKVKGHRFTRGAKLLEMEGVSILPAAGTTILKLGTE